MRSAKPGGGTVTDATAARWPLVGNLECAGGAPGCALYRPDGAEVMSSVLSFLQKFSVVIPAAAPFARNYLNGVITHEPDSSRLPLRSTRAGREQITAFRLCRGRDRRAGHGPCRGGAARAEWNIVATRGDCRRTPGAHAG